MISIARRELFNTLVAAAGMVVCPPLTLVACTDSTVRKYNDPDEPIWSTPDGSPIVDMRVVNDTLIVATHRGEVFQVPVPRGEK